MQVEDDHLILVKPMTFVNRSGQVLPQLLAKFKASPDDLLVVFDQMDLPPGRIRVKPHGSSAGHNGLKSIDTSLGGGRYHRLAIGVGRPRLAENVVEHVLGSFSPEDEQTVRAVIDKSAAVADSLWRKGWEPLIRALNQRDDLPA